MKLVFSIFIGLLAASGLALLYIGDAPVTHLVDASGGVLTVGGPAGETISVASLGLAAAGEGPVSVVPPGAATARDPFEGVQLLIDAREFEAAEARLLELLEESDRDGLSCTLLSEVTREQKSFDEAADYGQKATLLLPDSPRAHLVLARAIGAQLRAEMGTLMGLLRAKPRLDRFLLATDRVLELDPEDVEARKLLVMYHLAPAPIGDSQRALEICGEIAARDPLSGLYWSAVIREQLGESQQALELCRSGALRFPEDAGLRLLLGGLLCKAQLHGEADAQYLAALEGGGGAEVHQALYERAKMRIEAGFELEVALELLESYIRAAPCGDFLPSVAHALWRKGMALEGLGRRDDALTAYRESLRLDPEFSSSKESLAKLESEG